MGDLTGKLNEVLADEWACVRILRRAEARCDDPGQREVLRRIRKDGGVACVNLANVIRRLNGRPTDLPSSRFSLKLTEESLAEILDLAQTVQRYLVVEIETLIDEPELKDARPVFDTIRQLHRENLRWLRAALPD